MTQEQLDNFLEEHSGTIEWQRNDEEGALLLRDVTLPAYKEQTSLYTKATYKRLLDPDFTPDMLLHQIRKGLDVECITRITGYFAKTRGFNPGKQGELHDRIRTEVNE